MNYLDTLNPMQRQAVMNTEGPLLIFAGAGSGKTRVLTYRIARLIEQGVDPFHIIAITFTNKAAREMRERVNHITPLGEQVWVSTFHSTCVRLLRREISRLGRNSGFSIFDAQDSEKLIKLCIKELNLDDKRYPVRSLATAISAQKNELVDPDTFERRSAGDFRQTNIAEVYTLYQRKLAANNAMDFDDIIFQTVRLFEALPDVLAKYHDRFRYVMVDEYQDTNTAQYRLIRLLSGYAQNLCVVGDDDQSIYGWRGANIKNILRFEKDFPQAKVVKLEQNYRSTQTILDAANAVIRHNHNRSPKKLWTENEAGGRIFTYKAYNEGEEGAFVAGTVKRNVQSGARYNDFAVLYRNNAQSRAIEDQLVMAGVPYRLFGGVRFYERMEVKDVLSYLKALHNPADDLAYMRIINIPRRGIGNSTIAKIQAYAVETGMPFSAALRDAGDIPGLKNKTGKLAHFIEFMDECTAFAQENPVPALIQKILDDTNYLAGLVDGTEEGESRIENVRELLSKAAEFDEQSENKTLGTFLEEVALVADIDNYQEDTDTVALMTLHSAKGLEFNSVFIVGFEENIFPAARSALSPDPDDLEEERRLCYVGFTRARKTLYVTHAVTRMQYGQTASNAVSRFLKEVPREYIETVSARPGSSPARVRKAASDHTVSLIGLSAGASAGSSAGSPAVASASPRGWASTPERRSSFVNPYLQNQPAARDSAKTFCVGDRVRQLPYGLGRVIAIREKGEDQEISVAFDGAGIKKFMAHMSLLEKVDS